MMLAAVEAVTKADPVRESRRHDSDVAAQATAGEPVHAASPLKSSGPNVYNEQHFHCNCPLRAGTRRSSVAGSRNDSRIWGCRTPARSIGESGAAGHGRRRAPEAVNRPTPSPAAWPMSHLGAATNLAKNVASKTFGVSMRWEEIWLGD